MIRWKTIRRSVAAWALPALALTASLTARADVHQLALDTPAGERVVTVETVPIDDVPYVSLPALVNEAGGAFNALPTRLRVDLFGTTAWLRVGESRVHALSIFSLAHPVREDDGEVYIALSDLDDFFLKSFRVRVREMEGTRPEPAPAEPLEPATVVVPETSAIIEPLQQAGAAPPAAAAGEVRFVLIDPGHGGYNTGLEGLNGLSEKALTLAVATRVRELLASSDTFDVALTRDKDVDIPEMRRSMAINNSQADILVSLHGGSALSSATRGISIFYPSANATGARAGAAGRPGGQLQDRRSQESAAVAHAIAQALARAAEAPVRGVRPAPVRLLASVNVPSIMVELGCLTHPREAERLATEAYQDQLAQGIVEGLAAFANPGAAGGEAPSAPAGKTGGQP